MTLPFSDMTGVLAAGMPDLRGRLAANQLLAPFTWFRVGGPAQALFSPADEADLAYFLQNLPIPRFPSPPLASAPILSCATAAWRAW